jgi:endoglucanase
MMLRIAKSYAFITLVVAILFVLSCATTVKTSKSPAETNAFKINKLLGKGVNLGNALEAPNEGEWGVVLKEEYFSIIKQAGFNSIRLPVRWSAHALAEKPYTINPEFFKRVDWAVNCAIKNDLYVMLNIQRYDPLTDDPNNYHFERFVGLWEQIAEHYKDYPDYLLLELYNEPYMALTPELWNDLVKKTLPVIRKSNPNRTIVIEPTIIIEPAFVVCLDKLKIPTEEKNVIVSIHYYTPLEFTHQGAPWMGERSKAWIGTKWTGTDAEKKVATDFFDAAAAWGKKNNLPVNLGEFGVYKKVDAESRVRWAKFVAESAAKRGMSLLWWDFCAEFALYDRDTKSWNKELLDAVVSAK